MRREGTLPPGSTIGILGGGQLGRMLAVAASRLGLASHIYSDESGAPAFDVAAASTVGSYADEDALGRFAASVDVVTCEFENVPAATLAAAARVKPVYPTAKSFAVAQDRLAEKDFISALGIEVAPYAAVGSLDQLHAALARIKPPAILKTRRFGYDGKGQVMIRDRSEAESAWQGIGARAGRARRARPVRARSVGRRRARDTTAPSRSTTSPRTCTRTASSPSAACRPRAPLPSWPRRPASPKRSQRRFSMSACSPSSCSSAMMSQALSSTRSPRACTIQGTGRSMPAPSASSRTMSGRSPAGRSAIPRATAMR